MRHGTSSREKRKAKAIELSAEKKARSEGIYTVEKIVDCRRAGNDLEFRVQWLNHPNEDTWEPLGNLGGCSILLAKYLSTHDISNILSSMENDA